MKLLLIILVGIILFGSSSCTKYLDEKSDKSLATPSTISDVELLLNDFNTMNEKFIPFAEIMSDNYYVTDDTYASQYSSFEKNFYIWQKDATSDDFWSSSYRTIFQTNVILDALKDLKTTYSLDHYNKVEGGAIFFRSYYLWGLSQIYTLPFDKEKENTILGLPLRLSSNINENSKRASLKDTYDQIIQDLKYAANRLPLNTTIKNNPNKAAAYGALAKVYLSMKNYDSAGVYADLCIKSSSGRLLDFNTEVSINSEKPIPDWNINPEVILPISTEAEIILADWNSLVDTNLLKSYEPGDLRLAAFFREMNPGTFTFKGNVFGYNGSSIVTNRSISIPEMYLIRAESYARKGDLIESEIDINALLSKRIDKNVFHPLSFATQSKLLEFIIQERRRELLFTGARWLDLRRLRDDPDLSITPVRKLNNKVYELIPSNNRYSLLIPQKVIDLSGMPQNE